MTRELAAEEARMWRAPSAAARRIVIDIWKRRGRRRRVTHGPPGLTEYSFFQGEIEYEYYTSTLHVSC
jgi:hypothetical protein